MNRLSYAAVGALTASAAAGATAGGLLLRRQRHAGRPGDPRRFDDVRPERVATVQSEDGVPLHVEETGPADAPLTVVFVHGYALSSRAFHLQRVALIDKFGADLRLVSFDHRGHGRSGPSVPGSDTIDELGRDLYTVLDAVVPAGPVVLVGHSMGGMCVLALAQRHPELFAPGLTGPPLTGPPLTGPGLSGRAPGRPIDAARVTGVALFATSAGGLAEVSLGLPALIGRLSGPLAGLLLRGARRQAVLVEHGRRLGRDLAWIITRRFSFGAKTVSAEVVDFINDIIAGTRIETIADFYPTLMSYDVTDALGVLTHTDVLIVGGESDVMTPLSHSRRIADALPDAEFVVAPGAGHVVILEQPELVNRGLVGLVGRRLDQAVGRRLDQAVGRRLDQAAGRRLDQAVGRRLDGR